MVLDHEWSNHTYTAIINSHSLSPIQVKYKQQVYYYT
jgi:hypothetical protein